MKTKIIYKDFQIHTVPMERLIYDNDNVNDRYILLDDANEKRWKLKIKVFQALKITTIDCVCFELGDIDEECFVPSESFPLFKRHILEVIDSEWIKELKKSLSKNDPNADFMDKARHFVLPLYDNHIEIIAWDIELTEA